MGNLNSRRAGNPMNGGLNKQGGWKISPLINKYGTVSDIVSILNKTKHIISHVTQYLNE